MTDRTETLDRIESGGVIAVLRGVEADHLDPIATALVDGGISAIEVTADTPGVADLVASLDDAVGEEAVIGAGTVLDAATARTVLLAGAEFVVTPTLAEPVIETANRYGAPVVPGIMTPTEAQRAIEAGADAVKLFPAKTVGPEHLRAIRGPLAQVPIIPTGGVNLDNAGDYVAAGAIGVGVGGALLDDELIADEDWPGLEARAAAFVDTVADAR